MLTKLKNHLLGLTNNEVKKLIGEDKLEQAINVLEKYYTELSKHEELDSLTQLRGRLEQTKRQKIANPELDNTIELNKIRYSLIELNPEKEDFRRFVVPVSIGVILLLLAAFYYQNQPISFKINFDYKDYSNLYSSLKDKIAVIVVDKKEYSAPIVLNEKDKTLFAYFEDIESKYKNKIAVLKIINNPYFILPKDQIKISNKVIKIDLVVNPNFKKINGTVSDQTSYRKLENVNVYLKGTDYYTKSNSNGYFEINLLKNNEIPVTYELELKLNGYHYNNFTYPINEPKQEYLLIKNKK